jgi:hypothetical protein
MIPALERAKTVDALDRASTVIYNYRCLSLRILRNERRGLKIWISRMRIFFTCRLRGV